MTHAGYKCSSQEPGVETTTPSKNNNVHNLLALMAHIILEPIRLDSSVAGVAQRAVAMLDEACIRQHQVALLAAEAVGVPVGVHRLDHAPDHELACGIVKL